MKIPIRPYIFDIDLWSTKIWYNTLFQFICISIFVPHFYIKKNGTTWFKNQLIFPLLFIVVG
jgi:hypothetical protein